MNKKEITDYFRSNIFESYKAYVAWKTIYYSRSSGVVSKEMADRYTEIQNYHPGFFSSVERAFLVQFIILSLHAFDSDDRSFSLYLVDEEKTEKFKLANKVVLDKLFLIRNRLFAHKDFKHKDSGDNDFVLPPVTELDVFFRNLMDLYNELTKKVDDSSTVFSNADDLKGEIEHVFMNLYRGENARQKEIDIEWLWEKSGDKISDII